MLHTFLRRTTVALFTVALAVGQSAPAAGQISMVGPTRSLISGFTRGSDAAFDPVNNVYLSVRATGTQVVGAVTNSAGALVAGPVVIHTAAQDVTFPRVAYGGGRFLVVWNQGDGPNYGGGPGTNVVHGRTVTLTPTPSIGPDVPFGFSPTHGSWWEAGPAVAHSATSDIFLVTWQTFATNEVHGVRVSSGGQLIGGIFRISAAGEGGRDPGVAWNPNTNEFGVSFSGWDASSPKTSFARVRASDGALLGQSLIARSGGAFVTDTTFNSNDGTFVVAFAAPGARTAKLNASGQVVTLGLSSSTVGTYDGLALSYNPTSRTILMVGHYSQEVGGVELSGDGVKMGTEQNVSAGLALWTGSPNTFGGSFHPRATSASATMNWAVTYSWAFQALAQQIVQTGGSTTPPPNPGGGGGGGTGCPGTAPFPGAVCVNGGWQPGTGGSGGGTGGGSGCTGTAPFAGAVCVNGGWVPGTGGGTGGTGGGTGCPGTAPFPGAVCQNGGWVPGTGGGSGGSGGSGCTGTAPFAGAVCVNGGWVPGTGGSSGGGGGGSTCTTPQPGANWTCVNGGWLPPSASLVLDPNTMLAQTFEVTNDQRQPMSPLSPYALPSERRLI